MSEHTPGPWIAPHFVNPNSKCQCRAILDEHYFGAIAEVFVDNGIESISEGGNDCPPIEEARANARLIAAAPDLLEACEALADFATHNATSCPLPEEIEMARAAIAKAKGSAV